MRILLDTHAFLWAIEGSPRLSQRAAAVFAAPDHDLFLSLASVWEIVIKAANRRLKLPQPPVEFLLSEARANQIEILPLSWTHLRQLALLPPHHRDPFDRMLVAQAQQEAMPLLTADAQLHRYAVETIW